ncbi:NAD(P)H-binding protein [Nocardioides coralli]|uniref:NAD(P)H-binding protein n=1 Tax=Nocardioides coralli TaxID=2872154 RepID=UPI001CA4141C|nr:NAD(P)H-binding protein [Nocardioides coralli]QZY30651.1 NAD(P)H-binding protein [Nocardioides coralli]
MRILVLGATGYVGTRLVPALLEAGHEVVAASSSPPDPGRFAWGAGVTHRRCDVTDAVAVANAVAEVDAVCYLVHSLDLRDFSNRDRAAARNVRRAVDASTEVRRLVYLGGLVPDEPPGALSAHLASRLEVEQELLAAECDTLALRAGVVVGAGSTSFEVVRQLATLLLVHPIPRWLHSSVQPVAVTDVVRALVEGFDESVPRTGTLDVGGPDVVTYPRLLRVCTRGARLRRVSVPVLSAPPGLVSLATAGLVQAPFWTVAALVESLRHDMVCRPGETWQPADGVPLLPLEEAIDRALAGDPTTAEAPLASDPAWTRQRAPVLDELRAPAAVRAGASLALHRTRGLLRLGRG